MISAATEYSSQSQNAPPMIGWGVFSLKVVFLPSSGAFVAAFSNAPLVHQEVDAVVGIAGVAGTRQFPDHFEYLCKFGCG